jgi:NitT/TauT family transport system permease protein
VIGLTIGAVVALLCGLLFYRLSRTVAAIVEPYVAAFYAMPRIVLLPILAIELGRGTLTVLIFVSAGTFIYMLYSIRAQLASGDVADENAIRLMGGSSWQVYRFCLFPKLTGALLTGLVVAAPVGLGETLIAEMLAGRDGLGYLIEQASGNFQIPQLYAATVLAALVALAADLAAHRLFRVHKGATT